MMNRACFRLANYLIEDAAVRVKTIVSLAIAVYAAHSAIAGTNPIEQLSAGQWLELPNTKIRSVLPAPLPYGNPRYLVEAWSGGAVDSKRSRLIVWGGGHNDYHGNELYALDLTTRKVRRLTDPSPIGSTSDCSSILPDGKPTSRHTYGGIAYIVHADRLFAFGGSLASCGYLSSDTWTFDFATSRWHAMKPSGSIPRADPGVMAAYDPETKKVYLKDNANLYSYSLENDNYTLLSSNQNVDYHLSGALDTKRRKFVMIGQGSVHVIDLKTGSMTDVKTTGDSAIINAASPGLAYDPIGDRMVAWHGGNKVYALHMETRVWTSITDSRGPGEEANHQGTFGRWAYVPHYGVFALVNDIDQNSYVFKPDQKR